METGTKRCLPPAEGVTMARNQPQSETLHVVLDDATVERLRQAAASLQIEVEQLIVHVIHQASWEAWSPSSRGDEGGADGRPV